MNYRRHKGACPFYRENWSLEVDPGGSGEQMLYQIICLMDTPPVTAEEQHRCQHSPQRCWRLDFAARRQNGRNGHGRSNGRAEAESPADGVDQEASRVRAKGNGREEMRPQQGAGASSSNGRDGADSHRRSTRGPGGSSGDTESP